MAALDLSSVRRDVEALAAMERRSASPGERASAGWVGRRLAEAGAAEVRLQAFRYQHTFAGAQGVHYAAGLLAARAGGAAGRLLALAALVSYDLEFSGRAQLVRPLLPAGTGTNVVARVPARGERRRTLVLVAHHDAAHTGLMWDPRLVERSRGSFATLPTLAFALVALGARRAGGALLAAALALGIDQARSPTVPGASDNATGVAAVLWLVERFAREPLEGVEVLAVVPGCEESGMGGMAAWLRSARPDPATTLVLGLDTLGAGEPVVATEEGPPRAVRYRERDVALVDPSVERVRVAGWTDPVLAVLAGLPALSLLSMTDGHFTNYHLPTDTPENVDWASVERCIEVALATVSRWVSG